MRFKYGKRPARPGAVKFAFKKYADLSKLPTPPAEFGRDTLLSNDLGMLGNDQYGDCVWAGAAHESMLFNAERKVDVSFSDDSVLSDYSAVTGFNKDDPNTDQGTDMQLAAAYRQKTGVLDASGKRHQVGAYLAITPGDVQEHCVAAYLFQAVGIGIMVPASAQEQFGNGQPWDVVEGSQIEGGHYIPLVARRNSMFTCITWGARQPMTDAFFTQYNDESLVYVSAEMLTGGKSLDGFDLDQLNADLNALKPAQ